MDPELKKKLYESPERQSIIAAIETVRQTPDLIESHGDTLENFDSKTKSLFKLWASFYFAKVLGESCEDPVFEHGREIKLSETDEHKEMCKLVKKSKKDLYEYLCKFMNFTGWEREICL